MKTVFGVLGGDRRQLYLARGLMRDGFVCFISGFERSQDSSGIPALSPEELLQACEVIILPLPATLDGKTLNAPFSEKVIVLDDELVSLFENKLIYGGMVSRLIQSSDIWSRIQIEDYWLREDFALMNALPTAEGALALAVEQHPAIICGAKCLVTGFGRIGSMLTRILTAMGAQVTVAERKKESRVKARAMGARAIGFSEITEPYDMVFNTVPGKVLNRDFLARQDRDCLIMELASKPGGVDIKAAAELGLKVIDGGSLPGRFSPKAAGEYIKEAVYSMLEE